MCHTGMSNYLSLKTTEVDKLFGINPQEKKKRKLGEKKKRIRREIQTQDVHTHNYIYSAEIGKRIVKHSFSFLLVILIFQLSMIEPWLAKVVVVLCTSGLLSFRIWPFNTIILNHLSVFSCLTSQISYLQISCEWTYTMVLF